jgi:flagellar biosynthesis protein
VNRAIALRYDESMDQAPVVVAGGDGALAQMIARAADDYGIPVVRDVPLAAALAELAVGEEIPEELYGAVSAILREMVG